LFVGRPVQLLELGLKLLGEGTGIDRVPLAQYDHAIAVFGEAANAQLPRQQLHLPIIGRDTAHEERSGQAGAVDRRADRLEAAAEFLIQGVGLVTWAVPMRCRRRLLRRRRLEQGADPTCRSGRPWADQSRTGQNVPRLPERSAGTVVA